MKRVDLQIQTTYSDGRDDMATIMRSAKEHALDLIAITDHDTVEGIPEATQLAHEAGVTCIPGIELSVTEKQYTLHLLAYNIDWRNESLLSFLGAQQDMRKKVFTKNIAALNADLAAQGRPGINEDEYSALPVSYFSMPGVVKLMREKGIVATNEEGFSILLPVVRGTPKLFFPHTIKEAAAAVHASGGKAVLSHALAPRVSVKLMTADEDERAALIRGFAKDGLDGIELSHTGHTEAENSMLKKLADELGLFVTYGTDWHGPLHLVGTSIREYLPFYSGEFAGVPIEDAAFETLRAAIS